MMRSEGSFWRSRPIRIGLLWLLTLFIFSVCRLAFWLQNGDYFRHAGPNDIARSFLFGVRFDICSASYVSAVAMLLALIPVSFGRHRVWFTLVKWLYILSITLVFIIEMTDAGMFTYMFRRLTWGDWATVLGSWNTFPSVIAKHWYFVLLAAVTVVGASKLIDRFLLPVWQAWLGWWFEGLIFGVSVPLLVLGMRGGWQPRPISPSGTALYVSEQRVAPLVGNTTLSLIFSSQLPPLETLSEFSETELNREFPIYFEADTSSLSSRPNIVILALESFGCEYSRFFNPKTQGFTPFLDSLAAISFHTQTSYANGLRSNQGISSILTGIPQLMIYPWQNSSYQSSRVASIASLLKTRGYESGFCHMSVPGSMEFDRLAAICGFDHFYDMTAHPEKVRHFDGMWGLWDEASYDFFRQQLNRYKPPFFGFFFSITSHHPYLVPDNFKKQYPDLDPAFRATLYADSALRSFFEKAKHEPWFPNTIFVLVADHVGKAIDERYQTRAQRLRVPILFYAPGRKLSGDSSLISQQIDILPTVLGLCGYQGKYTAFGRDVFDARTANRSYSYTFEDNYFQVMDTAWALVSDAQNEHKLYYLPADPLLKNDACRTAPKEAERLFRRLQMLRQQYNNAFIKNKLHPDNQ